MGLGDLATSRTLAPPAIRGRQVVTEYGQMFTMHEQTDIDLDIIEEFLDIIEKGSF